MNSFIKLINNPYKFRLYLLKSLPAAFFSGIRVIYCDENKCVTSVPFKWLTQNPFRSTYFASLAMAAELSTGALATLHTQRTKPGISMLITGMDARYFKKAKEKTIFTCVDGAKMKDAVSQAIQSGTGVKVVAQSLGKNNNDELVAEFNFTWSLRSRREIRNL
ncbi:MAG: DUF4442 domain-containing protein [Ginsengibacter sp.]